MKLVEGLGSGWKRGGIARKVLPALILGPVAGANVVVTQVALGSGVFSGALAPYSAQGTRLVLVGAAIVCLFVAVGSGFRGAVGMSPPATMIILAGVGATLSLQGDVLFATMIAAVAIGSLATGVCAMAIGSFRLANLLRFVPYPLACGFLAGVGALCIRIALSLMGALPEPLNLDSLLQPLVAMNWGLGSTFGLALFLLTRRFRSSLILPAGFAVTMALFYLLLAFLDVSVAEAETAGLVLTGMSESHDGSLWPLFDPAVLSQLEWTAVATQVPNLLVLVLMTLLCLVVYLGSFELAGNLELDWNREFRAAGLASMAAGVGGAPPGGLSVPPSHRNLQFGADIRLAGVAASLFIALVAVFGDAALRLVPTPLVGGVLLFSGAVLLDAWLVKTRRKLPWPEFAIILLIFLTILFFGFLVSVGVGALVLVVFLLTRLAAVDPVTSRFTARERSSGRSRPVPDCAILRSRGDCVQVYKLRGYIFFGTAHTLGDRLKDALRADPKPLCILLDFDGVTGSDVSAIDALGRFILAAHQSGTRVALSGTSNEFQSGLRRDLPPAVHDRLLLAGDVDEALELCEDIVLSTHGRTAGDEGGSVDSKLLEAVADDLTTYLDRQILFEDLVAELEPWLEPIEYAAGETVGATGEGPEGMLLLTSGRASLLGDTWTRRAERGPGDVILGRSTGSSAPMEIRASEPCRGLVLTPAAAEWLDKNEESLMLRLYRYVLEYANA